MWLWLGRSISGNDDGAVFPLKLLLDAHRVKRRIGFSGHIFVMNNNNRYKRLLLGVEIFCVVVQTFEL